MKNTNPLIRALILCGVSGIMSSSGSSNTFQSVANSTSQTQPGGKEATILVDHYQAPCVNGFAPQWCYLLARAEKPAEFPYFYGDNVDESSNIYLFGEVKILTINAKLKSRLLQLLKTAGPMDWISGDFKHDQKHDNVITLISLQHTKL